MPHILIQKIGEWPDVFPASVSIIGLSLFWQKYSQEGGEDEKVSCCSVIFSKFKNILVLIWTMGE